MQVRLAEQLAESRLAGEEVRALLGLRVRADAQGSGDLRLDIAASEQVITLEQSTLPEFPLEFRQGKQHIPCYDFRR